MEIGDFATVRRVLLLEKSKGIVSTGYGTLRVLGICVAVVSIGAHLYFVEFGPPNLQRMAKMFVEIAQNYFRNKICRK